MHVQTKEISLKNIHVVVQRVHKVGLTKGVMESFIQPNCSNKCWFLQELNKTLFMN